MLSILTGLGAGEKIFEMIAQQPSINTKGGLVPSQPPRGGVAFQDV